MSDWKTKHANDSGEALKHQLVIDVIDELMDNISRNYAVPKDDSLVRYGLKKVAMYAAQVARAQAMGFSPDLLLLTEAEADESMLRLAKMFVESGKPVMLVVPPPNPEPANEA